MYNKQKPSKTTIKVNQSYVGETIEQKMNRIVNNKEPITDSSPLIYTERKDGVQPDYNIRTDRWEHAIDAMDTVAKTKLAQRQNRLDQAKQNMEIEKKTDKPAEGNQGT